MAANVTNLNAASEWPPLPAPYCEVRWYAAYTAANHEKRVADQFASLELEHFLPLYESLRKWKDRKVWLQLPLFPGYVFVRMALRNRLRVLKVAGVSKLVGFGEMPAPLPQEEIDALRLSLASGLRAEPHPYLSAGQRVRVRSGPLAGVEGILVRRKNATRFVLSVNLIARSVAVDIDALDIEPLASRKF